MPTQEDKSKKFREEVFRRYETLPPELKQAMASAATAEAIYAIGKKIGLNIEKTGRLADIIGYTILGIFPVADFVRNLKNSLEIDGTKVEEIAREVSNKIFFAIREQLKKTHGEKWDERALQQPPTTYDRQPTTPPTKPTTATQTAPMAPKSPWEIRPDGFQREIRDQRLETSEKSVLPPAPKQPIIETVKAAEAELKKMQPPEPLKTREAPQPAPAPQSVGVLKEIRPNEIELRSKNQEARDAVKPQPPTILPFMKEVSKLTGTPELEKLQQPEMTESRSKNQEARTEAPETKLRIENRESRIETESQKSPQKYPIDPYREPIE